MLCTKRLILRPLDMADAAWISTEIARPDVMRWIPTLPSPYRRQDAETFLTLHGDDPFYRMICHEGDPLGVVSIETHAPHADAPELGFWLAQHAWGHGVMSAAATRLVTTYFADHDAPLGSGNIIGNSASARVQQKLGFLPTGETLTRHSRFLDKPVPVTRTRLTRQRWQDMIQARP